MDWLKIPRFLPKSGFSVRGGVLFDTSIARGNSLVKIISTVIFSSLFLFPCQASHALTPSATASPWYYTLLKNDGTVWTWGQGLSCLPGLICTSLETDSEIPLQVPGIRGIIAIAKSGEHTMALRYDGTVWTWGKNNVYQLGDGSTTDRKIPGQVSNLMGVKAIAAGDGYCLALKDDGTVWAWGFNQNGTLGDGTTINRQMPVRVLNLTDIKAIATRGCNCIALKKDGTVWAWGDPYTFSTGVKLPRQVESLSGVIAISAGGGYNLALRNDGAVWAWLAHQYNEFGNGYGQLGDGTTTNRATPGPVLNMTGVIAITAGGDHSLALKGDGTVWAWGYNYVGQLGDGTTTNRTIPEQVSNLSGIISIGTGQDKSIAIKRDGTVWMWGLYRFIESWVYEILNPPQSFGEYFNALTYQFSLKDLVGVLQHTVATSSPDNSSSYFVADINNDGRIGTEEAIYILQDIAGLRTKDVAINDNESESGD